MISYFRWKWASLLTSISLLASVTRGQVQSDIGEQDHHVNDVFDEIVKIAPSLAPIQANNDGIGPVLIVSTMDGKVSALDMKRGGNTVWSVDIGQGPLVSSSISKLQVKQNGKIIRLIPSLSGGLFQFDGKSVEAVPFTADHLLSSSFKVTDDSILVGGKEVTTFGLDTNTGKIIYICSSSGCENINEASSASDIIIIKRQQQTVRSVENRNGQEKWNFTVGEVELDISKGKKFHLLEHSGDGAERQKEVCGNKEDSSCQNPREKEEPMFDDDDDDEDDPVNESRYSNYPERIRILLPEGVVCVFDAKSKQKLEWKHQFGSAIANAWYVENGNYHKLDLFNPNTVPALLEKSEQVGEVDNPTIYMGFYKSHVYIQVSSSTEKAISKSASLRQGRSSVFYQPLKFPYRPYLGTADQLTEAVIGEAKEGEIAIRKESNPQGKCGNSLAVYTDKRKPQSEMGYFFKSDESFRGHVRQSKRRGRTTVEDSGNESFGTLRIDVVGSSFMHWWKEILIITVTTSIFVQFLIVKVMQILRPNNSPTNSESTSEYVDAQSHSVKTDVATPFESRYLTDFETIQCLGRGGFGVVFEARNKLDDCKYAVKRIRLPNKPTARDKVMREVGLAKLEHPCIVRYFNAWIEEPPRGWQEDRDKELVDLSTYTQSPSAAATTQRKNSVLRDESPSNFKSNGKCSTSNSSWLQNRQSKDLEIDDTRAFSVDSYHNENFTGDQRTRSFDISFRDNLKLPLNREQANLGKFFQTSSSDSPGESEEEDFNQSIPFSRYNKNDDSSSIVFQDDIEEGKQRCSSEDSAIVKDVCNKKGHCRNESECADLPTYEQLYGKCETPGLRKRSNSQKPETPTDSDTTGSELKSVVCQRNSGHTNMGEKNLKPNTSVYLYLQMQLCQKDSLRTWLANNYTNRDKIYSIWIFQQVVSAVEYVHECSLIHRDLKPSNIFFSFDGSVKVGDFGLVTAMDESTATIESHDSLSTSLEPIGAEVSRTERVGTKLYMAPEQMKSRTYCQKVDIFALGLILFELLIPFGTQMERIRDLTNVRKSRFSKDFELSFPVEAQLAKQMLSNTPSHRPSANEISSHDVFLVLDEVENIPHASKNWNRKRTTSRN